MFPLFSRNRKKNFVSRLSLLPIFSILNEIFFSHWTRTMLVYFRRRNSLKRLRQTGKAIGDTRADRKKQMKAGLVSRSAKRRGKGERARERTRKKKETKLYVVRRGKGRSSRVSITSFPKLKAAGQWGAPRKVDTTESHGMSPRSFRIPTLKRRREPIDRTDTAPRTLRKLLDSRAGNSDRSITFH